MANSNRSRPRAAPGAKPNPAPAAQAPPGDDDEPGAVRDNRGGGWFWAHNEIIDDYAPRAFQVTNSKGKTTTQVLGAAGVAVYCALARHANKDGECWPGIGTMAKRLALSFNTVKTKLVGLEYLGLIAVTRNRHKEGRHGGVSPDSNSYKLLPIPATPLSTIDRPPLSTIDRPHRQPLIDPLYQPLTTNKTKGNKTQETTTTAPKLAQAEAQGGGGDAGKNAPELAEILATLKANGLDTDARHIKRLAAVIVEHAPSGEVARAEIEAKAKNIKTGKANKPEGVLYSRLRDMTADDWKTKTPAPVVTYRVIEAEE